MRGAIRAQVGDEVADMDRLLAIDFEQGAVTPT